MNFLKWLLNIIRPAPKPVLTEYALTGDQVGALCMGAKDHVYVWDGTYYALSLADWQIVFKGILTDLPWYEVDRKDCEDFAFLCLVRVMERYGLNTCGVAVGQSPQGYHGFNLFIAKHNDGFRLHILEPQNGMIDPQGYIPETVIFG